MNDPQSEEREIDDLPVHTGGRGDGGNLPYREWRQSALGLLNHNYGTEESEILESNLVGYYRLGHTPEKAMHFEWYAILCRIT